MILPIKLLVTPLLIAAASLAQRRWGGWVGGLIAGLPLTSAPVSLLLAIEHGNAFAARAAIGTLLGVVGMSVFCVVFVRCAMRWPWGWSMVVAALACCGSMVAVSWLPQSLPLACAIVFPSLALLVRLMGRPRGPVPALVAPWWDIPARMLVACAVVWMITGAAAAIGAKWSGLLSTLPVFGAVMGAFSYRLGGVTAAHALLRGFVMGAIGAASFFVVVAGLAEQAPLWGTYAAAVATGLAVVGMVHRWRT